MAIRRRSAYHVPTYVQVRQHYYKQEQQTCSGTRSGVCYQVSATA